jgi:hypothetical protein
MPYFGDALKYGKCSFSGVRGLIRATRVKIPD